MKRNIIIISVFMVLCLTLFADTEIPAGNVNGTWNAAGSPYNINGQIQIIAGEQLNIEAGVTVNFTGHYKMIVNGTLIIEGTDGNEVQFTAADDVTGWHGLRFIDTDGQAASVIDYCNFEYGRATGVDPDHKGGALYLENSSNVTFSYCSITESSASTGGAAYLNNSDAIFNYVEFAENAATGAGGAIYLYNSDPEFENINVTGNQSAFDGGGLNCFNSDPIINTAVFDGNTTEWNGGAISAFNNSDLVVNHLTIYGNYAEQDGSAIAILYSSSISMVNSIVWNNSAINSIYVETGSSFDVTYSDFQFGPGESWYTASCISENPLFADASTGDFQITWISYPTNDETKSPCIDTGDPESHTDADGTIADMGATFFTQSGLQGTVVLEGGDGVVTDVVITITNVVSGAEEVTSPDEDGNFAVPLEAGTYDILAELEDYSSYSNDDLEIAGELVTIDITLTIPPPGEITGQVDVEGIGEVPDVVITAGGIPANPYAVFDPDTGAFLYYEYAISISPGVYDVTAEMPGYVTQLEEGVIVQSGQQTAGIDFYLPLVQDLGTITGTVTLIGGVGNVENVVITAGDETVSPEADGTYEIILLNGTYDLAVSLDGYSNLTRDDVNVTAFEVTSDVNFDLINGWDSIDGTQYNMVVFATVTYDGAFMPGGSNYQLAAFGPGGDTDCRGTAIWVPGNHFLWSGSYSLEGYWFITIVSDDNGGDELITFKYYNAEDNSINNCLEGTFFNDGTYNTGINFHIDSPDHDFEYDLVEGWNWVSFYLDPADSDLDVVFAEIDALDAALQIKNHAASAQYFAGAGWFGALENIDIDSGYKMQMDAAFDDFTYTGEKLNPILQPIYMQEGWNMVSYLTEQPLDLETALQTLSIPDSTCIKTQSESALYFGGWIGDLEMMYPGKSYMINWPEEINPTDPDILVYPPHETEVRSQEIVKNNPADWELIAGTKTNMILMADLELKEADSYAAGIFDQDGNCHSIGKYTNDFWYFTIMGEASELYEVRVYDPISGETVSSIESIAYEPDAIKGTPQSPIVYTFNYDGEEEQISATALAGNYPNPFNPETEIAYTLAADSQVLIQVYNVKGQIVETLVDETQTQGAHSVIWKADNMASGVYFYKLQAGSTSEMRKCILMK